MSLVADIGINDLIYAKSYDEAHESLRRDTGDGVNQPKDLAIKDMPYIDTKTKTPGTRFMVRFDHHKLSTEGIRLAPISLYLVYAIPENADSADVAEITASFREFVASSSPDFLAQVINNEK